ncbi:hypothetical protein [Streptacidiphilus albus]|uniref:hypothetical protein n=1 Tax=Streptacidiphilus albus TaxID=105425 RepID=UPI00054BF2A1|nr:hypothetical protein [Streptacidiphilus albus]
MVEVLGYFERRSLFSCWMCGLKTVAFVGRDRIFCRVDRSSGRLRGVVEACPSFVRVKAAGNLFRLRTVTI